jgi:lysophospholipase L1-like esterase
VKYRQLYLRKNLDILDESDEIDYIILSVGTNDITKLDLGEGIGDLIDSACEHSKNLVHLANQTSQKYDIDVFIVERPARFDTEDRDPEGKRPILTESANGLFHSLITPLKRVHYIPLPSLRPGRAQLDSFVKDGVHLSQKGEQIFCQEIEKGVKIVFSDLKVVQITDAKSDGFQKAGKKNPHSEVKPNRKTHQNFQPINDKNLKRNNWADDEYVYETIPDGRKDFRGTSRNSQHDKGRKFQQDDNLERRNNYQQDGYGNNSRQKFRYNNNRYNENNTNHPNDQRGQYRRDYQYRQQPQHGQYPQYRQQTQSGQPHQYRHQTQHRQAGNRQPDMPSAVREYLQRFMQNENDRY